MIEVSVKFQMPRPTKQIANIVITCFDRTIYKFYIK